MSKTKTKRARVLIVDDHPAVREALALRIGRQRDLEVCGEAAYMSDALRLLADTQPDVAVIDISLKTGNGLATVLVTYPGFGDTTDRVSLTFVK